MQQWSAQAPASSFEQFLSLLHTELHVPATEEKGETVLDELIYTDPSHEEHIEFVINAYLRCAATRRTRVVEGRLCIEEISFVELADAQGRVSMRSTQGELPRWLEPFELLNFNGRLPSFLELSTILQAQSAVTISSVQLEDELRFVRHERDTFALALTQYRDEVAKERLARASAAPMFFEGTEDATSGQESLAWTRYDQMGQWAAEHEGLITLLPRALGGVKKALYEAPEHLYAGLEFLAGPYRRYRLNQCTVAEYEAALQAAGLRLANSVAPSVAGTNGDYHVRWRGRKRLLEWHLLRGGGRDERYCLRIYYFWCAETQRCVVGWMPSHLDNSLT